jgi:hypothetical protein
MDANLRDSIIAIAVRLTLGEVDNLIEEEREKNSKSRVACKGAIERTLRRLALQVSKVKVDGASFQEVYCQEKQGKNGAAAPVQGDSEIPLNAETVAVGASTGE